MTARYVPDSAESGSRAWNLIVSAAYAVIAFVCTMAWWRGMVPFPFLGGDAGDIASWAAAWVEPERFRGDMALGERRLYAIYAVLHIPLLVAGGAVFGDYGTAFLALLAPLVTAQAIGTYLLGLKLLGSRIGAFAFGLTAFGFTWFGPGDYYGFYHDAQPRVAFQALLPYLLLMQLRWAERPDRWPWLFAMHGFAMYVHPVSAPAVAFASWITLPVLAQSVGDRRKVWIGLAAAAAAFLAVALPFVVNYLSHRDVDSGDAAAAATIGSAFGAEFASVAVYLRAAFGEWRFVFLALPFGLGGAAVAWVLAPDRRRLVVLFAIWMAGILAVAVGLTSIDQQVARALDRQPIQIDLVRDVRFLLPVLTWLGFWGVFLLVRRHAVATSSWAMAALAAIWLIVHKPGAVPARETVRCIVGGQLFCPPAEWTEDRAALQVLKERLPDGATVVAALEDARGRAFSLAIRYYALRPVAFSFHDGGSSLAYSSAVASASWRATADRLRAAMNSPDDRARAAAVSDAAENLGAAAAVVAFPVAAEHIGPRWRILERSGRYTIMVATAARD